MATILVREDSTDTLALYPSIGGLPAIASAASARIRTPSTSLPDDGSAGTVSSISATVSVAGAAEGATSIPVTASTAWVEGEALLVSTAAGALFAIECDKTVTGTTLYLKSPLPTALASGDAILGWKVSIALTEAQTSERGPGIAVWTLTIGGVDRVVVQDFLISRADVATSLDSSALVRLAPVVTQLRSPQDNDYTESIVAGWELIVEPALSAKGIRPERILSPKHLRPLHVAAVVLHLSRDYEVDAQKRVEREAQFDAALDLALASEDLWYDASEELDGKDTSGVPRPFEVAWRTR